MSTKKYVKFAAPYASTTFNTNNDLLVGAENGVLSGGQVTSSGGIVTIQPITFIQQGLIVTIPDVALSAAMPTNMYAPYFVVVSVSSSVENVSEVITPTFIKRPQDLTPSMTLVAEYDGFEWRNLPYLSPAGIVQQDHDQNVTDLVTGISSGIVTSIVGSTYSITPGALIASDGTDTTLQDTHTLNVVPIPAAGVNPYDRIDTVVFRKPLDSSTRVGIFKNVVGPSFVLNTSTEVETPVQFSPAAPTNFSIRTSTDLATSIGAYLEGTSLKFLAFSNQCVPGSVISVATGVTSFAFAIDFTGNIQFFYSKGNTLYQQVITKTGTVIVSEQAVYSYTHTLSQPQVQCLGNVHSSLIHVIFCRATGVGPQEIGYMSFTPSAVPVTPYTTFINLSANISNPSMAKNDDDLLLYVGFENDDTGRAYLWTFDAGEVTQAEGPVNIGSNIELQTQVYNLTTETLMPTTGATNVKVFCTDNKEVYAVWEQFMGSGQYGIAVYNVNFTANFGYKALMPNNIAISAYNMDVDSMNRAYIGYTDASTGFYYKYAIHLNDCSTVTNDDVIYNTNAVSALRIHFCPLGDLLHFVTDNSSGNGYWIRSTAMAQSSLQSQYVLPSDIRIAYQRKSDGALSVADTWIGEAEPIKRLYEFSHIFAAAGTVSWGVVAANTLVSSNIPIRFLSRESVYTVTGTGGGGIVLNSGYAWYVNIPDDDNAYTLTPEIVEIGSGFLDRVGKKSMPLFWNLGGVLYSSFAPFNFPSGGSGSIGGTISDELISWLGSGSAVPDPTNHGYLSTYYIQQSDSINTAIGKLDTGLNSVAGAAASILGGIIPLTIGTNSVTFGFTARPSALYRFNCNFENLVDTDPMIQSTSTTAKTTSSVTVLWPANLDSGNYSLDFILKDP